MNSDTWNVVSPVSAKTETEIARWIAITAMMIVFASFLVMAIIGVMMRMNQAQMISLGPARFYSLMTLHGMMQVGGLFLGALYAVWYVLVRYTGIRAYNGMMASLLFVAVIAVAGVLIGTLVGQYGVLWTMLYPLEFHHAVWPSWSTGLVSAALLLLGLVWAAIMGLLLFAMGKVYGFRNLLGLQYLFSRNPSAPIPPIVLITTVIAIDGILGVLSGAAFLISLLIQWWFPSVHFDVLVEKNLVFFFGHVVVNVTLYFIIAIIYEMMPRFTGRPWGTNRVVVYSWLATLLLVLVVYSHHLYMDFVQPTGLEYLGQVASYASAIPATVVTVFGFIPQVYRLDVSRWRFVPATFAVGIVGWIAGGFAAVVDSTITNNLVLHNTLWVPAHFHTYYLMGVFVWMLGVGFYLVDSRAERLAKSALTLMVLGGYGFLIMFYLGGVFSVPRRFSQYANTGFANNVIANQGAWTAEIGAICAAALIVGYLVYLASLAFPRRGHGVEPDSLQGDRAAMVAEE